VFETIDGTTRSAIETAIRQAILHYEPRITLIEVTADMIDWREGRMSVTLEYSIDQTNARSNMVFPFYIDEGTLVSDTPVMAI
jgi:phage baseplate assembly protein W